VRVHPAPGVTTYVCADGQLELRSAQTGRRFRCDGPGTAMWIALRQHDGECTFAAETLAQAWECDPGSVHADLCRWTDELIEAGLLHAEPATAPAPEQPSP